jgi:trimeric autotransporter adhesin
MSQNDFTIANQGFPAFRADLNTALQALATNNSGATAPSTTFANMWWYDSATDIMYIRNEDNDAWIKFAELDQTNDKFILSGTLQLDDGTVSAPALTFNSDTNMGIYRGGTDILKFVTAGTDAITIDASQGVTLAGKLDVSSGTIKLDGNYPVGTANVALGDTALDSLTSGGYNVAIGNGTLSSNTSANGNNAVGHIAMAFNTTGATNNAFGNEALTANTTGSNNSAFGHESLKANTTGSDHVAIGYQALSANTTANINTAIGYQALYANTTGWGNLALGPNALDANTTGLKNIAVGGFSLTASTTGGDNTAVGYNALVANTTAADNVAVGSSAMSANTTGTANTAVGTSSMALNTTASNNTAVGMASLNRTTTGANNTAVGKDALLLNTTGAQNTAIGCQAGSAITTSSNHTIVGYLGGQNPTGSHCTAIGNETNTQGHSGAIVMGLNVDSVASNTFTFGVDDGLNRVYNTFTSNASWTRVSDERYKKNITQNTDCGLAFINDLNPVTFNWKSMSEIDTDLPDYNSTKTEALHTEKLYGLIAQEVKTAMDNNNITDFGGWSTEQATGIQAISQEMFVHPLIKAVQELSAQVTALTARITELEG